MDWSSIITDKRTGITDSSTDERATQKNDARTDFQRDFDRIIFSSGFRRLQDKTQVFPLPGATFVHNRLTHSLEVASVGRSLGKETGRILSAPGKLLGDCSENIRHFYLHELQNVIASACLAHDIGNPAFGHSGEKAISRYFKENKDSVISGDKLINHFNMSEWEDLTNFEGNANGLRILTRQFNGKNPGGLLLTYTTLASLIKYPCESIAVDKHKTHRKKYGFFQTEKALFNDIFHTLKIPRESQKPEVFARHPFVLLTEAADDICYRIIDFEDAHRLKIITSDEIELSFLDIIKTLKPAEIDRTHSKLEKISDKNERIAYLRAKCINYLSEVAVQVFIDHAAEIIEGRFNVSILDKIRKYCPALKELEKRSNKLIYHHKSVVEIEIAGYNVMDGLLKLFVPAVLEDKLLSLNNKVKSLIPAQFRTESENAYERIIGLLDFISGMTDPFATEIYRRITGIEISKHL